MSNMINEYYNEIGKSNYYLGMVTQVYDDKLVFQVENLSILSHRELGNQSLIPNTINYYVVIESIKGLFFGEVYQSRLISSDNIHLANRDRVWPEISINVLGVLTNESDRFNLPGNLTAGISDKVYIANNHIISEYFECAEIIDESKEIEKKLSSFAVLSNNGQEVAYTPSTLFDKHLMVVGTTNSGKSTSALSILDQLIKNKIKVLIIDPAGEYKDGFSEGENITKLKLGENTNVDVGKLSMQNWETFFGANGSTQPAVLADAIESLQYQGINGKKECYVKVGRSVSEVQQELAKVKGNESFELDLLSSQVKIETIEQDKYGKYKQPFNSNVNRYLAQKITYKLDKGTSFRDFFSPKVDKGKDIIMKIKKFAKEPEKSLYIDCSSIGLTDSIGGTIIDIISNYIVNLKKSEIKPFIVFIDEVHRYTTKDSESNNSFYDGLTAIAREGRKKGIFLFLTTQNPNDVDKVLLGQVGTLLVHRLTQHDEISAIRNHLNQQELAQINKLNTGEAILTSTNLLTNVILKIKKCEGRKHNNETPSLWGN